MLALSTDVGTSIIKTVAFDGRGEERAVALQGSEVPRPRRGFAEQMGGSAPPGDVAVTTHLPYPQLTDAQADRNQQTLRAHGLTSIRVPAGDAAKAIDALREALG